MCLLISISIYLDSSVSFKDTVLHVSLGPRDFSSPSGPVCAGQGSASGVTDTTGCQRETLLRCFRLRYIAHIDRGKVQTIVRPTSSQTGTSSLMAPNASVARKCCSSHVFSQRNPRHLFPEQHGMRRLHPQEFVRQFCVVERHEHVPRGF